MLHHMASLEKSCIRFVARSNTGVVNHLTEDCVCFKLTEFKVLLRRMWHYRLVCQQYTSGQSENSGGYVMLYSWA